MEFNEDSEMLFFYNGPFRSFLSVFVCRIIQHKYHLFTSQSSSIRTPLQVAVTVIRGSHDHGVSLVLLNFV